MNRRERRALLALARQQRKAATMTASADMPAEKKAFYLDLAERQGITIKFVD